MDRGAGGPVMVASPDGGVDIEAVAEKTPERIFKEPVDIKSGLKPGQTLSLAKKLGLVRYFCLLLLLFLNLNSEFIICFLLSSIIHFIVFVLFVSNI